MLEGGNDSVLSSLYTNVCKIRPTRKGPLGGLRAVGYVVNIFKDHPPKQWRDRRWLDYLEKVGEGMDEPLAWSLCGRTLAGCSANLLRYDRQPPVFGPIVTECYREAAIWADAEFGPYCRRSNLSSYTRVLEHLDSTRSPGLPECTKFQTKDQYWMSEQSRDFDLYWSALVTGKSTTLCKVIGKEQLTNLADLLSGKNRTVVSMDVNHVVAHGVYTLHQNLLFKQAHSVTASSYGSTLLQGGANRLVRRMSSSVPSTIELDGKRFDARFQKFHFDLIRDLRWSWLSAEVRAVPEHKTRFDAIYEQLSVAPFVNVDGTIYERSCGNPSGQFCTTVDNTIKNYLDMCVLYMLCAPPEYRKYLTFRKLVRLCIYGDDVNITVDPSIHAWFNPAAIKAVMADIDMEYEFASDVFRYFHDCKFLGHGFRSVTPPNRTFEMWVPVIDCVKMKCGYACWGDDSDSPDQRIMALAGYRNETFGCAHCRRLYQGYIDYLVSIRVLDPRGPLFRVVLPDVSLWSLYTGLSGLVACGGYRREASQLKISDSFILQSSTSMAQPKKNKQKTKPKAQQPKRNQQKKQRKAKVKPTEYIMKGLRGLGTHVGQRLGQYAHNYAYNAINKITGMGAYHVRSNTLMGNNGPPVFGNSGTGGIRVRHREYLGDITGSVLWAVRSYYLNPGLAQTFPWLSSMAVLYEQYKFHGLVFEYKSMSADALNSTNTALGSVIMATDYDDLDAPYFSKQQMEAAMGCVSTRPSGSVIHPVECSPRETPITRLWVRNTNYSQYSTVDPRLYDLGVFQLATVGMQAAANIGELWVSYDVEFFKPTLGTFGGDNPDLWAHLYGTYAGGTTALFMAPNITASSNLPVVVSNPGGGGYQGVILNTVGQFMISFAGIASTSISSFPTLTLDTNAQYVSLLQDGTGARQFGSGTARVGAFVMIQVLAVPTTLLWSSTSVTTVGTGSWDLMITSVGFGYRSTLGETRVSKLIKQLDDSKGDHKAPTVDAEEKHLSTPMELDEVPGIQLENDIANGYEMWHETNQNGKTLLVGCGPRYIPEPISRVGPSPSKEQRTA